MAKLYLLFLFASFITTLFASPLTQQSKRSFKINRVRQANYVPHGPSAIKKAYSKFIAFAYDDVTLAPNSEAATRLSAILAKTSSTSTGSTGSGSGEEGEVSASPTQNDAEFLSPITVGGQTLVMDFDTGSSDLWVFSTNLPSADQQGHTIYDPSKSTTAQAFQGAEYNISYGDGSFSSGPAGFDAVNIGGATVSKQAIGLASDVAASFVSDTASNGLVGLAFSQLNTIKVNGKAQPQDTFFANVQNDLAQPVFTANLKHGTAGAYEFGEVDQTAFTGSLSTTAVNDATGFWQFPSTSASVNGQTVQVSNGLAIADTGTSLLLAADAVVQAYYGQVQGAVEDSSAGGVVFPCNSVLPDLQLAIGSAMATVSGSLLNFAQAGTSSGGTQYCFGGLQSNAGLPFSIYGDVFFKSNFVVFDGSGPSLSFAPHA